jgi:hypothetical protein
VFRREDYVGGQSQVDQWHGGYLELQMRNAAMTKLVQASFVAIGRHLRDDYSQRAPAPLPRELKDLLSQLVAFDFAKQSNQQPVAVLQAEMVQALPRSS